MDYNFITEDDRSGPLEGKKVAKEGVVRFKEALLEVEDLTDRDDDNQSAYCERSEDLSCGAHNTQLNYNNILMCSNCDQNLVLSNLANCTEPVLCVSCTRLLGSESSMLTEPTIKISIPKDFSFKEQRIHDFVLGIDTVIGFPIFAGVNDEPSCYVDYKFPIITSNLKGK